jgi:hypothetical protein
MSDAEFPFVVTEDEEIIARFKHLKDAAKFASYHEWGDFLSTPEQKYISGPE